MADYSVALVTDPRIDYEAPRVLPARVGPNSFTAKKFEAPDPTSTSPTITVQCPSYNTGIGRVVFYHMKAKLTITGTDLQKLNTGINRIALRAFPIHAAASSMTLSINDVSTSIPAPFSISSALLSQGFSSHSMALCSSTVPCAPDMLATYQAAGGVSNPFGIPAGGPFSSYSTNSRTMGILSVDNDSTAEKLTINIDIREPLLASPFSWTQDALMKSLLGVNSLQFAAQLTEAHRMLSIDLGTGNDTITVTGVTLQPQQQELEVTFTTAEPRSQVERPLALSYDYTSVQLFTTQPGDSPAANAVVNFSSATVELPVAPAFLLIRTTYSNKNLKDPKLSLADVNFPLEKSL